MMKSRKTTAIKSALGAIFFLLIIFTVSSAKTTSDTNALIFTSPPASGVILPELDEFATTVMHDPWDMNENTDLWAYRSESAMINSIFANGLYSAQMTTGDGGERITLLTAGAKNNAAMRIGKIGYKFPINAGHYRYLTYRFYKSNSECNTALIIWFETDAYTSDVQGISKSYPACETAVAGWHTKVIDLATIGIQAGSKEWSGTIRELILKPFSGTGAANATVKLDWARLTHEDPRSARPYTIRWTGGSGQVDLYASPRDKILDNNDILIAADIDGGTGAYTFQTGVLPAGDYYIGVDTGSGVTWSSGPLVINTPPHITITRPSKTSGQDYAETEKGNAWDMNDSNDLNDVLPANWETCVSNPSFNNSIYSATMTGCSTDSVFTDARLILGHMNPSGKDPTIDTSRYRYFSFRYMLEGEQNVGEGWLSRFGWWQTISGITTEPTVMSRDIMLVEGWHTYSVDLWAADVVDEAHSVQVPWISSAPNRLRFDPAELYLTRLPVNFYIDWIKLTAMDEVVQGDGFPVEYDLVTDGAPVSSIVFYYDKDTNPSNGRDLVLLTNSSAQVTDQSSDMVGADGEMVQSTDGISANSFIYLPIVLNNNCSDCMVWDTIHVAPGDYYICIEASDAYNSSYQCSEAPVKVKSN
ncbi:MAG: hypothetical protein P8183_13550 [Anaerolineae bacterium]